MPKSSFPQLGKLCNLKNNSLFWYPRYNVILPCAMSNKPKFINPN